MNRAMIWKVVPFVLAVLVLVISSLAMGQSPDTAGFTLQPYQCTGSTGHRIVLDQAGTAHMIWMRSVRDLNTRNIWYNCWSNGSWSFPAGGTSASRRNRDGYGQLAVNDQNGACVVFHNSANSPADSVFFGSDAFGCLGTFAFQRVPDRTGGRAYIFPFIARSSLGDFQVVESDTGGHVFAYTRSSDGGSTWSALQLVDSINGISPIVVASPVSNKVCIAYTRNHHDPVWTTVSDLMYVQSLDGRTWDFVNGLINVTQYATDNDSIKAGFDIDAIYDYNDNLHFVWQAKAQSTPIIYQTKLMHYSVTTGLFSQIGETTSPTWPSQDCNFPINEWHFAKVSMGVQGGTNNLYAAYTDFDSTDCSRDSVANGDIYLHSSYDNGMTWTPATDITNSPSPNCAAGDCESEEFPSMAERVNDYAHIFYECKMGGGAIADNPMLYLRYYVEPISIGNGQDAPKSFSLSQNFPNPFNAATTISFTLEKDAFVKLAIYDIIGNKVATLADQRTRAGKHDINWNAGSYASGIYYYRIAVDGSAYSKKMVLMK